MNIQLLVMNGYEATREVRKFMSNPPVIAVIAYAESKDKRKYFEAGCNDFIFKPISKTNLFMTVDRVIKK